MSKVYLVKVKEDYRWTDAQVDSRLFSKKIIVHIGEASMTKNILNSEILEITETTIENERLDAKEMAKGDTAPEALEVKPIVNIGPRRKTQAGKLRG